MKFLETLNDAQREAVKQIDGPVLVVAGAGTGKTKTLISRIIYLINSGVSPENILAITFTNKAAGEMRERIDKELRDYQTKPYIKTFHSLSAMILRDEHGVVKLPRHFTILDQGDSRALVREAMKNLDYDPKRWEPKKIQNVISKAKGEGATSSEFESQIKNQLEEVSRIIWDEYERLKGGEGALDFDDLLAKTYLLLKSNGAVREKYQSLWKYVHIDEYQDTNKIQYKLAKLLSVPEHNLFAVGDSDQNIYSWRGANIENILHFERDFNKARIIILNKNYRSTKNILSTADSIISKNKHRVPKELQATLKDGEMLSLYIAFSENDEANWIANKSSELIRSRVNPNEIAVLFRTNFQSRVLEGAFLYSGIPHELVGTKFFERAEVKDALAYLRAALNPSSLTDLKRIINLPRRGLGKVAISKIFAGQINSLPKKVKEKYENFVGLLEKINNYALQNLPHQTIKYLVQETGLQKMHEEKGEEGLEKLSNLKELVSFAAKYKNLSPEEALEKFLEDAALMSDQDTIGTKTRGPAVKLMTIHAAKGLEFDYVFISGMEQGLFPSEREEKKNKYEAEEERRLCYVAITRAKKKIFLSYAHTRTIYGNKETNEPSEFIGDIPEEILEYEESEWGMDNNEEEKTIYLDF